MQIDFPAALEEKLAATTAKRGCAPGQLVQELAEQYLDEHAGIIKAVRVGRDGLRRGDFLTEEQMAARLQSLLQL